MVIVRKMLKDSDILHYYQRKKTKPCPIMDSFREVIRKWLDEDKKLPKSQRHTRKEFTQD